MSLYNKIIKFLFYFISTLLWIIITCWTILQYMYLQEKKFVDKNLIVYNKNVEYFLPSLGLKGASILYPNTFHKVLDLPVFILALKADDDIRHVHRFLGNFRVYLGDKKLIIYDLGISKENILLIRSTCQCLIRRAYLKKYPIHVQILKINAYRSIIIQETLQEFGIVFWCNIKMRFMASSLKLLPSLVERSKNLGIIAWSSQTLPTSALTHKSTLQFLNAPNRSVFNYLRMAEPDAALYCNTYRLHVGLMLPWVKCALTENCIAPYRIDILSDMNIDFNQCSKKKPIYKYTGCHRFDTSVFNVILGKMFHYDSIYIPKEQIFRWEHNLPPIILQNKYLSAVNNIKTTTSHIFQKKLTNDSLS